MGGFIPNFKFLAYYANLELWPAGKKSSN